MATSLPDFPPFDTESEPTSLGIQWKKWILRLENLFVALDIKQESRIFMMTYWSMELMRKTIMVL